MWLVLDLPLRSVFKGLHMPVINVPAFVGANEMPIGVSLVAGRFRDQHLLRIGRLLSVPLMAKGGGRSAEAVADLAGNDFLEPQASPLDT